MIKYEGVYYFGGKRGPNYYSNELSILLIEKNPFKWIIPETVGQKPLPRYQHRMILLKQYGAIALYGGKNDK